MATSRIKFRIILCYYFLVKRVGSIFEHTAFISPTY